MLDRTTKGESSKPRMSLEVDDPLLLTELREGWARAGQGGAAGGDGRHA